jgi:hypothetical protein
MCCGRLTLLMVTKVSVTLKYKWLASQMSKHTVFKFWVTHMHICIFQ